MTEINIAGSIDKLMVFDDPEYCDNNFEYCSYVKGYGQVAYCCLTGDVIGSSITKPYRKTKKCKEVYEKAK